MKTVKKIINMTEEEFDNKNLIKIVQTESLQCRKKYVKTWLCVKDTSENYMVDL